MAKPKYQKGISPAGVAVFPSLTKPDTKFDKKGVYHTKLAFDPSDEDVQAFIETLETARDNYMAELKEIAKSKPKTDEGKKAKKAAVKAVKYALAEVYSMELDDEGEETGRILFNFKKAASFVSKKTEEVVAIPAPPLFDSGNNKLPGNAQVWGGSILKVAFHIRPYAMDSTKQVGISLKIDGIQVKELVGPGEQSAESLGFEADADGYTAPAAESFGGADAGDDDGDEDEF